MDQPCLNDDTLLDFVAGKLPDPRRADVEQHLAGCTMCSRLVSAAVGSARETVPARAAPGGAAHLDLALSPGERLQALAPGTLLAETYRIVRLIGTGGMGEVYEASHTRLTGRYAVKVLHHHWAGDPRAIVRFGREAQITSGLRHPNIVAIIDFDYTPAGAPYLVMEYIEGVELAAVIANQAPMPPDRVARIVDQIASALTAVHARNIVHRDLKPQNIFLVPGDRPGDERVKLVDFGISKVRAASVVLTGERAVLGTPQYMAPEQAQAAGEVDGRADQFALAAIVYEMLTGRMAFPGDRMEIVVYRISHEEPAPLGPAWGQALAAVLVRALSKDPAKRFPSADDFAAGLRTAVETDKLVRTPTSVTRITERHPSQDGPPPLGPETRERHSPRRRWTVVGGLGAGLALAGLLALPLLRRGVTAREELGVVQPAAADRVAGAAPAPTVAPAPAPVVEAAPAAAAAALEKSAPDEAPVVVKASAALVSPAGPDRGAAKRRHARPREERPKTPEARTALEKQPAAATIAPTAPDAAGATPPLTKVPATTTRESKMGSLIDRL